MALPGADLGVPRDGSASVDLARVVDLGDSRDGPAPPDLATGDMAQSNPDLARPTTCGGFQGRLCDPGNFCDILDGCGFADQGGTCQPIPGVCGKNYDPECGCDDKPYGNDCERQRAGVSLWNRGVCGCQQQCGVGKYCAQCFGKLACLPIGAVC